MRLHEGLLADVAGALPAELAAIVEVLRFRRLEPERRVQGGAALDTQAGLLDDLAVVLLRGLAFGAPKRFRHLHEIPALGLRDEAGERQQFPALVLRQARQVRAISLDGTQHPHACAHIVVGEGSVRRVHGLSPVRRRQPRPRRDQRSTPNRS
jgi:hypothetical protein